MGRSTGIYIDEKTGRYWVDKRYRGVRLRDHFPSSAEAQDWLILQLGNIRRQKQFGERPKVLFREAAAKYLTEKLKSGMPSAATSAFMLDAVMPYIGDMHIDRIHDHSLTLFKEARRKEGRKTKTINESISAVTTVLNRAATLWKYEDGLTWLERAPKLVKLTKADARPPRTLDWDEEKALLQKLPRHLADMAKFMLNTGARDNVVVSLEWAWELKIPDTTASVFVVPGAFVKGEKEKKRDTVLVLNSLAQEVLERNRGRHDKYVFVWRRERTSKRAHAAPSMSYAPIETMNNTAWQRARREAGLGDLHVHDLRHTVGQRLREAGLLRPTVADILWHGDGSITEHYSVAKFYELYDALERLKGLDTQTSRRNPSINSLLAAARKSRLKDAA